MLNELEAISKIHAIRPLDLQFARFVHSIETVNPDELALISMLLSHELSKGHICIQVSKLNVIEMFGLNKQSVELLNRNKLENIDWKQVLASASSVATVNNEQKSTVNQPLVFDGDRLYLQRYWYYESFIAKRLNGLAQPIQFTHQEQALLAEKLRELFPEDTESMGELNWQKIAVAVALTRRLSVISGGPGTGKTTTVVKLLSALMEQGINKGEAPKVKLVAPTGKAAARLTESIGSAIQSLSIDESVRELIPIGASTIHRLLGAMPNNAEFRHGAKNPLHLDMLVVDEASMVDLPLMAKLLDALPSHARLILLGDKDQLASVEAGAVLGDICSFSDEGYSIEQSQLLADLTSYPASIFVSDSTAKVALMSDSLCMLRKSYRFNESSGIGVLAKAINVGDVSAVRASLKAKYQDVDFRVLNSGSYQEMIERLRDEYTEFLDCVNQVAGMNVREVESHALKALKLFANCRLLCAVREGDFGLIGLNQQIEKALSVEKTLANSDLWYPGRPVMITRNDHSLGLFNGDIGITLLVSDTDKNGETRSFLKVFFELPDGSLKAVLPSRIPEHDTAYAMTIHKSQGSEFPVTVMVLPAQYSPILTKELIYTGVTRAKSKLVIYADSTVLLQGVKRKTDRLSGLKERLKKAV